MRKIKTVLNTTVFDVINCISNLYGDESDDWYIEIKVTNVRDFRNTKDLVDFICKSVGKFRDNYISTFKRYDWSLGDMKELITEKYLNMYVDGVEVFDHCIVIYAKEVINDGRSHK